jgi:hypothetical protein
LLGEKREACATVQKRENSLVLDLKRRRKEGERERAQSTMGRIKTSRGSLLSSFRFG